MPLGFWLVHRWDWFDNPFFFSENGLNWTVTNVYIFRQLMYGDSTVFLNSRTHSYDFFISSAGLGSRRICSTIDILSDILETFEPLIDLYLAHILLCIHFILLCIGPLWRYYQAFGNIWCRFSAHFSLSWSLMEPLLWCGELTTLYTLTYSLHLWSIFLYLLSVIRALVAWQRNMLIIKKPEILLSRLASWVALFKSIK